MDKINSIECTVQVIISINIFDYDKGYFLKISPKTKNMSQLTENNEIVSVCLSKGWAGNVI